jgi:nicotinamidase/pyrazinamidase
MNTDKALILIDIQNDFLPGGALAVPEGDAILPILNRLIPKFDFVVATQDWHPPDHGSFAANHPGKSIGEVIDLHGLPQILWPVHCVQDTHGAKLAGELSRGSIIEIFQKGTDPKIDSYSGLFDNGHRKATGLAVWLSECGVDEVYLAGLATDYCVKHTALDAAELGFRVFLILDACRGVNLTPGDVDRAIAAMRDAGVEIISSTDKQLSA